MLFSKAVLLTYLSSHISSACKNEAEQRNKWLSASHSVGQHSNDYIYVMNHLAPDIHYHSWRSKHSLSDADNIEGCALPAPLSDKIANNSALSPTMHVTRKQARWSSPQKTLPSTSSVRLPQLGSKQRKPSFCLSPMHPVAQNLPADSADMLTVKAIDQGDLRLEDLALPS